MHQILFPKPGTWYLPTMATVNPCQLHGRYHKLLWTTHQCTGGKRAASGGLSSGLCLGTGPPYSGRGSEGRRGGVRGWGQGEGPGEGYKSYSIRVATKPFPLGMCLLCHKKNQAQ